MDIGESYNVTKHVTQIVTVIVTRRMVVARSPVKTDIGDRCVRMNVTLDQIVNGRHVTG